jgi:hypothetical protein
MIFFLQAKCFQNFVEKDARFYRYEMEKRQMMSPLIMFSELSVKHAMRTSVSYVYIFMPI